MNSAAALNQTVIGLLLHDVTDDHRTSGFQQPTAAKYKHTIGAFRQYLNVVKQSGLSVTSVADFGPAAATDSQSASPHVQFTFDDGGSAALATADLLDEFGWKGLFFVTTDFIGSPGFMTAAQVQELDRRGHVIGSHSCSHPEIFRNLHRPAMRHEWQHSRNVLEDLLGHSIHTGSVPGGDSNSATLEEAAAAGLTQLYTSEQTNKPWSHSGAICFGRMMMLNSTSPKTLERWLAYPTVGIFPEQALRLTKTCVKKLMGPAYASMVQRRRAQHGSA